MLDIKQLSFSREQKTVLQNISLNTGSFDRIGLAGQSGSGKTTLLKLVAGLLDSAGGEMNFNSERIIGPSQQLIPGNQGIAYISQDFKLRNNYRVWEELDYTNAMSEEEAMRIFHLCRIDHLLGSWTDEISGGEQQRIYIARALISKPQLLLLDEPYSNLDVFHKQLMKQVVSELTEQLQIKCILVSHDPQDLLSWAEHIYIIKQGELVEEGDPHRVYTSPLTEYSAGLFGSYNVVNATLEELFPARSFKTGSILRPGAFAVHPDLRPGAVAALITGIHYFGNYVELDVRFSGETTIKVFDMNTDWTIYSQAFISLR